MKLARRSTSSLILTALALGLVVAFSVWCIGLTVTVTRLRADEASNVKVLVAIEDLRAIISDLDRIALIPTEAPTDVRLASWRETYAHADERLGALEVQPLALAAQAEVARIRSVIEAANVAGLKYLAADRSNPSWQELRQLFGDAHRVVHGQFTSSAATIRGDQAAISATLGRKWRSLYSLALLSATTVIVLLFQLRRARIDAYRHVEGQHNLQRSEALFRSVLAGLPDVVIVMDRKGFFRHIYAARPDLMVAPHENLVGQNIHERLPRELASDFQAVIDLAIDRKQTQTWEYPLLIQGTQKWFSARVVPYGTPEDPCVIWVARDMTDRRLAEEALQDSEERLRDANERLEQRVRERIADLSTANEMLTNQISERERAENIQAGRNKVLQLIAGGASLPETLTQLAETVEDLYSDMLCSVLLLDKDKKHLRHGAAPSLPDFYNEAIDGIEIGPNVGSCGTAAYTGERVVIEDIMTHPYWKDYRDLAGQAGLGASWSQPIISSTNEILGTFAIYYREPRSPDERVLGFIESAADLAGIAIERHQAEIELSESQALLMMSEKLASLGTLTAGLGHDMNNILFPIRCRFDAVEWKRVPREHRELPEAARDTVEYLQQLCDGLRLFAVDPEDTRSNAEATALSTWWRQVEPLLAKLIPDTVKLETQFPTDIPPVAVAPHRLTQAVLNLVTNAADAMPDGGHVSITARADGDPPEVKIVVADDGTGMREEVRQRAFDPFFTTKKRTLSTGLGLSLVLSLMRRSRGSVDIASSPGSGTTVTLTLPVADANRAITAQRGNGTRERAAVSLGDLRRTAWVTRLLTRAGYDVTGNGDLGECDLWVTEPTAQNLRKARVFSSKSPRRRLIVLGAADTEWMILGAIVVENVDKLEAIRAAVDEATAVHR